jgi:pimeloyl-ACP methyl ester carboxylesterase
MTAFVLVSGGYTGGWIWRETAARLRQAGAEAYPATLTGLADRRHLLTRETGLGTHVEDVVQLIDHIDTPGDAAADIVLVGHCYGIYPVLGAADRRAESVARVVFVDAPMPEDGVPVLGQVPCEVREWVRRHAAEHGDGWLLQPPALDERLIWGSLDGIPDDGLARLARLASPQPVAMLEEPMRLTGACAAVPTSGVFCTANGLSTDLAQTLVDSGEPHFQVLADPRVGFFDLETGHWPMLSRPEQLADVLLRAAAGEGRRLIAAPERAPAAAE